MLLKYFYDEHLAHASYLVGCQRSGEAVVVDPGRDTQPYLDVARRKGLRLVAVAETHIHADYVSGARDLADRVNARLFVSDEGPAEWKYEYVQQYDFQLLKDGDVFHVGRVKFEVMHTPGHTPESISFVLTDQGGGADRPMGIFTGDFIFVGSIGRPDLLEEAAGMEGTADPGARQLFQSVAKFRNLPEFLQVWPAHGAGSACGKGLGAIPSSTVGYELLFNPALQIRDEQTFVDYILSEQPEAPKYFALMKRVNKVGPAVIDPSSQIPKLAETDVQHAASSGQVVDLANFAEFAKGHVPGTINIPVNALAGWAGWLLDYEKPIYLIGTQSQMPEAIRTLQKIGVDPVEGYFDEGALQLAGFKSEALATEKPEELHKKIASGNAVLVDVRGQSEWDEVRIPQAHHMFLGRLPERLPTLKSAGTIIAQCQGGGRSAIASSILQAAGLNVINMAGGLRAWEQAGLEVQSGRPSHRTATRCST